MKVAVIGAGISGLAAAIAATERAKTKEVVVFEREAEVGGRARSLRRDGFLVETGPNAFLGRDQLIFDLARRAGLTPRESEPASRCRLLYRAGENSGIEVGRYAGRCPRLDIRYGLRR